MSKKYFFTDENGYTYPEWEQKKFRDVLYLHSGKDQKGFEDPDGPYPILATGGEIGRTNTPLCSEESVLIGRKGTIDKPRYINTPFRTVDTLFYTTMKKDISAKFIHVVAQTVKWKKLSEASGVPSLNSTIILNVDCILPSFPEQQKIAEFFSALDERIALTADKVKLLREQKAGYLQKVFSRELVFTDENGDTYGDWEQKKLADIAEIVGGGTPSTGEPSYWDGNINWFSPTDVGKSKYLSESARKITEEGLKNSSAKIHPKGTVLLTTRATLGRMGILRSEAATNQGFQSLLPKENTIAEFLYYLQPQISVYCDVKASGSTFKEISGKELAKMPVKLPSLPEQERIAKFFSALDEQIELTDNKLTLLKEQKNGYLQGIFG